MSISNINSTPPFALRLNWVDPDPSQPLYVRVTRAITPIIVDLVSKGMIPVQEKEWILPCTPSEGEDITEKQIQVVCQKILQKICLYQDHSECSIQNFPQELAAAVQNRIRFCREEFEQLNPPELYRDHQTYLGLSSKKNGNNEPVTKEWVLTMLKHFTCAQPYLSKELQSPISQFLEKLMHAGEWFPEFYLIDKCVFQEKIEKMIEAARFLQPISPLVSNQLQNVFRRLIIDTLQSPITEKEPRGLLPKLSILMKASSAAFEETLSLPQHPPKKRWLGTYTGIYRDRSEN